MCVFKLLYSTLLSIVVAYIFLEHTTGSLSLVSLLYGFIFTGMFVSRNLESKEAFFFIFFKRRALGCVGKKPSPSRASLVILAIYMLFKEVFGSAWEILEILVSGNQLASREISGPHLEANSPGIYLKGR